MKYIRVILIIFSLLILQLISQNLFVMRYVNWIAAFGIGYYLFGKSKEAVIIIFVSGLLFDGVVHNMVGISGGSVILSLLILTVIDDLLKLETFLNRLFIGFLGVVMTTFLLRFSNVVSNSVDASEIGMQFYRILYQIIITSVIFIISSYILKILIPKKDAIRRS